MRPVGNMFVCVISYLLWIYVLVYSLFGDFSTLNYKALYDWMVNEWLGLGVEGSSMEYFEVICWCLIGRSEETHK